MSSNVKVLIERSNYDLGGEGSCGVLFDSDNVKNFMCHECERMIIMPDAVKDEYPLYCPYCGLKFTHAYVPHD